MELVSFLVAFDIGPCQCRCHYSVPFNSLIRLYCFNIPQFVLHSPIDIRLISFQFGAIMNKVARNTSNIFYLLLLDYQETTASNPALKESSSPLALQGATYGQWNEEAKKTIQFTRVQVL